jgi:L,D-peptidoglycan transpeptidase YkuD (ErfK/YbiS/YcfS/YnhG family)
MRRTGRRGPIPALLTVGILAAACSASGSPHHQRSPAAVTTTPAPSPTTSQVTAATSSARPPSKPKLKLKPKPKTTATRVAAPAQAEHHPGPQRLPLPFGTGRATEVITVVAPSTGSTQGTLQAWHKVSGGWRKVGGAVHAWLGSDGLSNHPSETRSATPIGSFTLTQAFGHDPDPGTSLPYTHTTPDDWWISQSGPLYNTRQRCASNCAFTRGDPNEHLYYETPYYDYALVIDYNTRNAPGGVRQGAGSAFFLHVTVGAPTAGCVSIPGDQLVRLLRWLTPGAGPRIMIGTG